MHTFKTTITRYATFIRWLLPDSLWRNKWLALTILATGFLGVAFQIQVFGLIIYYARHFSSGELISLAGHSLDPRTSVGLLGIGSAAVVVLLLLSALCIYFSRRGILRMGREYEEFCGKRVYFLLGRNAAGLSSVDECATFDAHLFRLIRSDSRLAGRVLRMLLSLIIPGLTLAVAVTILIYLEPALTLLIAAFSAIFTYYQYRVSREAAEHSMLFEKLAPAAGREYRGMLAHCKQQSGDNANQGLVERLFASGPVKKQLDSYERRLRAVEKSRLVSGVFMAVVVGLILLVMGAGIIDDGQGWGKLLIYVVALRFAMGNLQTVFSTITAINRFYPQVRRYYHFIQSVADQDREQYPALDKYELRVESATGESILPGSLAQAEVLPGRRATIITPLELNRYTMASMTRAMLGAAERAFKGALFAMRFATSRHSCPGCSLRKALNLGPETNWKDLRAWFADQEAFDLAKAQLPKSLDKEITPKAWELVDPGLKFILSLLSARWSDCQWILLEAKGLAALGNEAAKFYLDLFQDRILIIVFNTNLHHVGAFQENLVAVMDEERLVGLGTVEWFETVRERVEGQTMRGKNGKAAKSSAVEDDELDEM